MIQLVDSVKPVWHTFHRAWGSCVCKPDKKAWKALEDAAWAADAAHQRYLCCGGQGVDPAAQKFLETVEALAREQGGSP